MQQPAPSQPSPNPPSFAGLLAALATPQPNTTDQFLANGDAGEDVATLSYERALRAHACYRLSDRGDFPVRTAADATRDHALQAAKTNSAESPGENPTEASGVLPAQAVTAPHATPERNLRPASVTIRLSREESAQLHQRASEAELTVSAYLRSCAFEVDALRTQVKAALAELRKGGEQGNKGQGEQANKELEQRGFMGISLARVLIRIGRLCIGLSSRRSS